jgi:hypothetical protein
VNEQPPVRAFLEAALKPPQLARLDQILDAVDADDAATTSAVREFLERVLSPEQMAMLNHIISEIDSGPDADARRDKIDELKVAARQRQNQENNSMHANDSIECADLRARLRSAGIPVGNMGGAGPLKMLMRYHRLGGSGLAQDSRRRAQARPDLALDSMFPRLSKRFESSSSLAVYPDRESPRSSRPAMAQDSRFDNGGRLSIEKMFPKIAERLGG